MLKLQEKLFDIIVLNKVGSCETKHKVYQICVEKYRRSLLCSDMKLRLERQFDVFIFPHEIELWLGTKNSLCLVLLMIKFENTQKEQ